MTSREKGERGGRREGRLGRREDDLERWTTMGNDADEEKKIERIERADARSGSFKEAIS